MGNNNLYTAHTTTKWIQDDSGTIIGVDLAFDCTCQINEIQKKYLKSLNGLLNVIDNVEFEVDEQKNEITYTYLASIVVEDLINENVLTIFNKHKEDFFNIVKEHFEIKVMGLLDINKKLEALNKLNGKRYRF